MCRMNQQQDASVIYQHLGVPPLTIPAFCVLWFNHLVKLKILFSVVATGYGSNLAGKALSLIALLCEASAGMLDSRLRSQGCH